MASSRDVCSLNILHCSLVNNTGIVTSFLLAQHSLYSHSSSSLIVAAFTACESPATVSTSSSSSSTNSMVKEGDTRIVRFSLLKGVNSSISGGSAAGKVGEGGPLYRTTGKEPMGGGREYPGEGLGSSRCSDLGRETINAVDVGGGTWGSLTSTTSGSSSS